jgi:hypothetical protein
MSGPEDILLNRAIRKVEVKKTSIPVCHPLRLTLAMLIQNWAAWYQSVGTIEPCSNGGQNVDNY